MLFKKVVSTQVILNNKRIIKGFVMFIGQLMFYFKLIHVNIIEEECQDSYMYLITSSSTLLT